VAQGTPHLKWKGKRLELTSCFKKDKKKLFCFYKNKGYKYKDELGLKKIATIPQQQCQKACWYFLTFIEINLQAYGITVVAFIRNYSGYPIFPRDRRYFF